MKAEVINTAITLMKWLETIPDRRDHRGKRHALPFVLACVIMAILSNRSYLSSIHRFITHKLDWLKMVFDCPEATAVSRAQLPNILAGVDWGALNGGIEEVFAVRIVHQGGEWNAVDGKSLNGTIQDPSHAHQHERIVTIVGQTSHDVLYQQRFSGDKESEVTVVRELLEQTGLVGGNISLDAGHAYPDTLAPIHHAGGRYVVQVKLNQPQLFETLAQLAAQAAQAAQTAQAAQAAHVGPAEPAEPTEQAEQAAQPAQPTQPEYVRPAEPTEPTEQAEQADLLRTGTIITTVEKGHGRLEERVGRVLSLNPDVLATRWESTGMQTVIVMDRLTEDLKTGHTSAERSYYVSNQPAPGHERELFDVIRGHWRIESMNWVRDVTFNEDRVRTKHPNLGQVLSLLRTIALKCLQPLHPTNLKATLETFADRPDALHDMLVRFKFVPVS